MKYNTKSGIKASPLMIILIVMIMFSGFSTFGQCTGANSIQDPTPFAWTYHPATTTNPVAYYSGVMEVGQATFIMNNGQTLTTRAYRQQGGNYSIPGPTIKVVPGNKYVLRFQNTLPYAPLNTSMNVYKDPNVSNIHTHGLHISGESPGDDVMRAFEGGRGGDFVWDIPADHMGGTFWYHAHHHGSSYLQISGGLFGLLIVDDSNDGIPASVASMTEKQLVVGYLDPGAAGTGGDVLLTGSLTPTWTVNGVINGNICMPPNTWQHWRILTANRSSEKVTLAWGAGTEIKILSRDGVWRTIAPLALSTRTIDITGASRVDVAIRTTGNSTFSVQGTVVANIIASGTANSGPHPFAADGVSTWSAKRPSYLRDLRGLSPVHLESVSMGARTINGSKFNMDIPNFTLQANQIQEWSLSGALNHPFHLHTHHLQAQSSSGSYEAGEYYDVLTANITGRFDLNAATSTPYSGMAVMHCHLLDHEDQGAMGWMNVVGGKAPPTFPNNGDLTAPYSEYYILGNSTPPPAPSGLTATAGSSSSISLVWTENSSTETGFKVERSLDGSNFSALATLGINAVNYTDNGLTAGTKYYYRVMAFNTYGNSSPSNIASATTLSGGSGSIMSVSSLTVTKVSSAGKYKGVATVRIVSSGLAVSGATVTGTFSGPSSGTASGTTDVNGQVILNSVSVKTATTQWCFEVISVSKSGSTYSSSSNTVTKACENGPVFRISAESPEIQTKGCEVTVGPNPFSNMTTICVALSEPAITTISVTDITGKTLRNLYTGEIHPGHMHAMEFDGCEYPKGMYFLVVRSNNSVLVTKRMMIDR